MSELTDRYPTFKNVPLQAKVYILFLLAVFVITSIFIINQQPFKNINWLDFFIFLITTGLLQLRHLKIPGKGETIDPASFILFAVLLIFKPEIIFIIIFIKNLMVGELVDKIRFGTEFKIWIFLLNIDLPLSYYYGALAFNTLKSDQPYFINLIPNIPALAIAAIIAHIINYGSHFIVLRFLFKEETPRQTLIGVTSGSLTYDLSQVPIGVLLAITYHYQKISIILFTLPALLYYVAHNYQSRMQQKEQEAVDEKRRIEQDAHDRIYNRLGALAQKAELALSNPDDMKSTLSLVKDDLRKSVSDLQTIVSGNMQIDSGQDKDALKKEIEMICNNFKAKTSINLDLKHNPLPQTLDPMIQWHFQCILEECLNNVHKHSQATEATVNLINDNDYLILTVTDNGIGLSAVRREASDVRSENDGMGLSGMRERAAKIGGTISFSPNNGAGTKIELKVPISN